jgi:hypothetical protein
LDARRKALRLRHKETHCTGAQRNRPKQTEEGIAKTGAQQSGPKQTSIQTSLSGPRYRGSNPCLPASSLARARPGCAPPVLSHAAIRCAHRERARIPASHPTKPHRINYLQTCQNTITIREATWLGSSDDRATRPCFKHLDAPSASSRPTRRRTETPLRQTVLRRPAIR